MSKTCFKCGVEKPLDEFYRHGQTTDGHLGKCKECAKSDVRLNNRLTRRARSQYEKRRYQQPRRKQAAQDALALHRRRHPDRDRARSAVKNAIKRGDLVREPCEVCGQEKSQAHHDDYSRPLKVRWLCFRHHRAEHGQVVV